MTKEEFEQLKSTVKQWLFHTGSLDPTNYANELMLKFIEPREKQIVELKEEIHTWKEASSANSYKAFQLQEENKTLAQHILELQNDKGNLVDEVKSLKAQIEEMKCCGNCAWWYKLPNGQRDCAETCENRDNWSLRR